MLPTSRSPRIDVFVRRRDAAQPGAMQRLPPDDVRLARAASPAAKSTWQSRFGPAPTGPARSGVGLRLRGSCGVGSLRSAIASVDCHFLDRHKADERLERDQQLRLLPDVEQRVANLRLQVRLVDAIGGKRGDERHRLGLADDAQVALLDRAAAFQQRRRVTGNHCRRLFVVAPFDDLAGPVAARFGRFGRFGSGQLDAGRREHRPWRRRISRRTPRCRTECDSPAGRSRC